MFMSSKHIAGVELKLHTFLNSALDGSEWLLSHTSCCTPGDRMFRTLSIDSWWTPEIVWMYWRRETSLAHAGT